VLSKYESKSGYRATVNAGAMPKRISGHAPLRLRPIFVILIVASVALRRVLVRGGEAAALVSRPAHAANSRPQRYLNFIQTESEMIFKQKRHDFSRLFRLL